MIFPQDNTVILSFCNYSIRQIGSAPTLLFQQICNRLQMRSGNVLALLCSLCNCLMQHSHPQCLWKLLQPLWTDLYVLTYPQASRSVCGSDWRTNPILL